MSDKDRIAFERALSNETLGGFMNDTITPDNAWSLWQAARDHYAPKLTEAEAVEAACRQFTKPDVPGDGALWEQTQETDGMKFRLTSKSLIRKSMLAALRAAGVKFRNEA